MKLSEAKTENINDEYITRIVFDGIFDDLESAKYAIVFGHYQLQKYRVEKTVQLYKQKRVQKIIFSGGVGGFANHTNETVSEAVMMSELAISLGVKKEDIYVEDKSNSTIENVKNVYVFLKKIEKLETLNRIILISSEFHMKRCLAIARKVFPNDIKFTLSPALDGYSDKDNWYLSDYYRDSGRFYVIWEEKLLVENAQKGNIVDLDVEKPLLNEMEEL